MTNPLVLTRLCDFPLVNPGDLIGEVIWNSVIHNNITLQDGDIFVIAQKIISKAEGRFVNLREVRPSSEALNLAKRINKDDRLVHLILSESNRVLRTRPGTIIVEHKLGFVCANAGIDHSNVFPPYGDSEDWVLLLPEDPDQSANRIRQFLEYQSGQSLGVLIIDTHGRAWRLGTVGVTIGISGIPAIIDMRGKQDLRGYVLRVTQIACADELAAAGSLMMGQAAEGTPVIHIRGFPYPLTNSRLSDIIRPEETDLFR